MVLLTKHEVVNNMEFKSDFITFISSHSSTADTTIITGVYLDLVKQMINTMANSFLNSQDMLERIANNKGVDAQMTLRDKLKAYARATQSKVQL